MALWFKFVYGSNLVLISIVLVRVTLLNSSLNKISRNLIVNYTLACARTGWSIKMNRIKVLWNHAPSTILSLHKVCVSNRLYGWRSWKRVTPPPGWMVFNQIYFIQIIITHCIWACLRYRIISTLTTEEKLLFLV